MENLAQVSQPSSQDDLGDMGGEAEDNGVSEGDEQCGQEGGAHLLDLLIRGGSGEPQMAGET